MIPMQLQPLIDHVWQSTFFAVMAGALTLALRNNRAHIRYCLWLAASVKFLIPLSILVDIGDYFGRHFVAQVAPPRIPILVEHFTESFVVSPSIVVATTGTPPASSAKIIFVALGVVWAIGFIVLISSWWLRWLHVRTALRTASPIQLPVDLKAMSSLEFMEPGVFGICDHILLVPEGITERLTAPQLEAILAHELCHARRRDNLATAVHMVVEAVFWFHPLVWFLGACLMEERERACDEEVLRIGKEPQAYAEGVIKVCELYLQSPLRCVSGVTGSNLKKRIQAILIGHAAADLSFPKKVMLAAAGMAFLTVPLVAGMMHASVSQNPARPADTPKWEVVSVKPCVNDFGLFARGGGVTISPGRANWNCQVLEGLVNAAYLIAPRGLGARLDSPITGGPSWIKSDRYTIDAKAEGTATKEMIQGPMLQEILEDRFKLKLHFETKEVPVYALTVGKSGPKLQPFMEGSCVPTDTKKFDEIPTLIASGEKLCLSSSGPKGPSWIMHAQGMTLDHFAKILSISSDRKVINHTGITGRFDFHLEYANPRLLGPPDGPADVPATPSIFAAVEELGLRLEATKGPGEFLVIDSVERPTEN